MAEILSKKFWDVESYKNLFCCGLLDDNDHLDMHYIVNSKEDEEALLRACLDSGYDFTAYDLTKDASKFKQEFEKCIPRTKETSLLADFLGVEDKEVEPKKHWYFGFNILNYDLAMYEFIANSILANKVQTTTESIRKYSDQLINKTARYVDTNSYALYANQVDCAMLNEKMVEKGRPTIGQKTLVGIKGGSIIESKSNKKGVSDDIYDDVLYNINDITELRDVTYPGVMETTFKIRKSLLDRYPKLTEKGLTVNSTSAKFVEYIVAPDSPIKDTPTVTFMYPAPHIAHKLGVEQTDVLEDTKDWYMENVFKVVSKHNPEAAMIHLAKFLSIYEYYSSVRGKNWNDSATHAMEHGIPAQSKEERAKLFDNYGTFLPFIDKYGNDSGTYANFSLGGIHGAEINQKQLERDRKKIGELKRKYGKISMIPKKEVAGRLLTLIKLQSRTRYKNYPQRMSHEVPYIYRQTEQCDEIIDPEEFTPFMYVESKEKEMLIGRYKYTSTGESVHQDFAGYYPMLLINLGAFYDGNGVDPYEEVYNHRINIKKKLKTIQFGTLEYELVNIEQEGYKLVLNSASGVLDGSFDTNLRANNKAMAMRIIGQLFTFRIGMALALEGATIPSSNTDGIYVFNIDIEKNTEIVDRELEKLYVAIDPEPVYLVSKDANNRMEMEDGKVISARGGTLTSWSGARVDQRLAHPALVDKIMTYYLQHENILDGEANKDVVRKELLKYYNNPEVLKEFENYPDAKKRTFVYMASWVIRSTSGSIMVDEENTIYPGTTRTWLTQAGHILEKYGTRKVKPSDTLEDYASKLFPNVKLGDPDVIRYLTSIDAYDEFFEDAITVEDYYASRTKTETETTTKSGKIKIKTTYQGESVRIIGKSKISHMPEDARVYINNNSILKMSEEEIEEIYNSIDLEGYVTMISEFANVWQNVLEAA